MADTGHIHPAGTQFLYSTDGVTYTQVFDLQDVDAPDLERGESDDTTLNTPGKILLASPGWIKLGDVTWDVYLVKGFLNTMLTHFNAGDTLYWRILFILVNGEASGTHFDWQGWIKKLKPWSKVEKGSEEKVSNELVIHNTTLPVLTLGA